MADIDGCLIIVFSAVDLRGNLAFRSRVQSAGNVFLSDISEWAEVDLLLFSNYLDFLLAGYTKMIFLVLLSFCLTTGFSMSVYFWGQV